MRTKAYLKVKDLIEVGRLLGLTSPNDNVLREAEITREARAARNLQLVVELCLTLIRKDHGTKSISILAKNIVLL